MARWVALLRGVNVGGSHRLPMALLRDVLADAGCSEVRTYLQSGNAVFSATGSAAGLSRALESALTGAAGFTVPVVLRSAAQLTRVVDGLPYRDQAVDPTRVVVTFLSERLPRTASLHAEDPDDYLPDAWRVAGKEIYVSVPNGQSGSTLTDAFWRKHLKGVVSTSRNWRTVVALRDLAAG